MEVSLIMGAWKRPCLLELGLWSLTQQKTIHNLEIIVCNDYLSDGTEEVCKQYSDKLNIKYIFTGQRNYPEIKWRSAGYALNIGVKQSSHDIIILSCPEIVHLNNTIDLLIEPLIYDENIMTIGQEIWFDDTGNTVKYLQENRNLFLSESLIKEIKSDVECKFAVQMPYCLAMLKKHYIDIGGYDEDAQGYAGEDNDLINRLKLKGLTHFRTNAQAVHLFHGSRCDSKSHYDNEMWLKNWTLFNERKHQIIRNKNRSWGTLDV